MYVMVDDSRRVTSVAPLDGPFLASQPGSANQAAQITASGSRETPGSRMEELHKR